MVADLFARARRSVLVSSYSFGSGATVFAPLAARMAETPGLRVRMFFDITVGSDYVAGPRTRAAYEARFFRRFCETQWRGARIPDLFHDPRTIDNAGIHLHAKCIVIDDETALVASANTSAAAQEENIEAGVLVEDRLFALTLGRQFDDLVTAGLLVPIQGLARSA